MASSYHPFEKCKRKAFHTPLKLTHLHPFKLSTLHTSTQKTLYQPPMSTRERREISSYSSPFSVSGTLRLPIFRSFCFLPARVYFRRALKTNWFHMCAIRRTDERTDGRTDERSRASSSQLPVELQWEIKCSYDVLLFFYLSLTENNKTSVAIFAKFAFENEKERFYAQSVSQCACLPACLPACMHECVCKLNLLWQLKASSLVVCSKVK